MEIVTFSDSAIAQIKKSMAEGEHGTMGLRLAAKVTPDETLDYGMGFDETKEDDAQFEHDGISVMVAPDCLELLNGAHLDFVEIEAGQFQFIFLNPNDPNYKPPSEEDALDQPL